METPKITLQCLGKQIHSIHCLTQQPTRGGGAVLRLVRPAHLHEERDDSDVGEHESVLVSWHSELLHSYHCNERKSSVQ